MKMRRFTGVLFRAIFPASLTELARVVFRAISPPQAEPSGLGFAWVRRRYFPPKRR